MSNNNNNNNTPEQQQTTPVNPQKLQHDYTYPVDDDEQEQEEQQKTTNEDSTTSLYSEGIKSLAQSKVFTIHFIDGTKKVYMRRKPSLGEVGDYEEAKQHMIQFKGKPKAMNQVIIDFYTYAASIHLRETKNASNTDLNAGSMSAEEVKKTVFEDFKKVIDACEYAMLFNPN